jgi:enhancer of mRNA-decapping protein 4
LRRVEESLDPTIELNRLLRGGMLEEAFNKALTAGDLQIVFWLCHQLDPVALLSADPPPVSQGVLLSLVQQLSSDLSKNTGDKLRWIKEATLVLNPRDPVIGPHMHSFLELAYQNCHHQMGVSKDPSEQVTLRLVIHVINSLLSSCK